MVVHLVGADAVQADTRLRGDQKVKDPPERPAALIVSEQGPGWDLQDADVRFAHEPARPLRFEAQQLDNPSRRRLHRAIPSFRCHSREEPWRPNAIAHLRGRWWTVYYERP